MFGGKYTWIWRNGGLIHGGQGGAQEKFSPKFNDSFPGLPIAVEGYCYKSKNSAKVAVLINDQQWLKDPKTGTSNHDFG